MKKNVIISLAAVAGAAGLANATLFFEAEPNNTLLTAQDVGSYDRPGDAFAVDGRLGGRGGDVDWYRFEVSEPATVNAAVYGRPTSEDGDSVLGLFDAMGGEITVDDDDNIGLFSSIEAIVPAGVYYLAVSGFPDFDFVGDHTQTFGYKLVVGLNIPAPASLAGFGILGLAAARRRRA